MARIPSLIIIWYVRYYITGVTVVSSKLGSTKIAGTHTQSTNPCTSQDVFHKKHCLHQHLSYNGLSNVVPNDEVFKEAEKPLVIVGTQDLLIILDLFKCCKCKNLTSAYL